jgi:hypothetical protein
MRRAEEQANELDVPEGKCKKLHTLKLNRSGKSGFAVKLLDRMCLGAAALRNVGNKWHNFGSASAQK